MASSERVASTLQRLPLPPAPHPPKDAPGPVLGLQLPAFAASSANTQSCFGLRKDMLMPSPQATVNVTALGDRHLCRWSAGGSSGWVLIQHDWCPCKMGTRGQRGRHAQREDGTTTEAGTGAMRLRAKDTEDCWEGQGGILLESRQRKGVPRKLDFGLATSRAERRYISAVSSHPGHCNLLQQLERAISEVPCDSVCTDLSLPPAAGIGEAELPRSPTATRRHHFTPRCAFAFRLVVYSLDLTHQAPRRGCQAQLL